MNPLCSHIHCPRCEAVTLHTSKGCCHCVVHESKAAPRPTWHRTSGPRTLQGRRGRPRSIGLTPAESRVAKLLAVGATQVDIAEQLGVSRGGVASMIRRAMDRVGAESQYELAWMVCRARPAGEGLAKPTQSARSAGEGL